jgi:hypothetical protein
VAIESVLIGFGHRARHGKDAAAAAIIQHRSGQYDIRKYSFAQELKQEVNKNALASGGMHRLFDDGLRIPGAGYYQTNGNYLALPDWVQYDPNPDMSDPDCPLGKQRTLLQWWGTEYRRNAEPSYWINKLSERLEAEKPEIALITDMRFPNEMEFCLKYGEVVKVERLNPDGTLYVAPGVLPHASEEALAHMPKSAWSGIITNDGTLEDLQFAAVEMFDTLIERTLNGTL